MGGWGWLRTELPPALAGAGPEGVCLAALHTSNAVSKSPKYGARDDEENEQSTDHKQPRQNAEEREVHSACSISYTGIIQSLK